MAWLAQGVKAGAKAIAAVSANSINGLDMASGGNDVVVVEYRDGKLRSTPFNIRFGRLKTLRGKPRPVSVEVNGAMTDVHMRLGPHGVCEFVESTEVEEQPEEEEDVALKEDDISSLLYGHLDEWPEEADDGGMMIRVSAAAFTVPSELLPSEKVVVAKAYAGPPHRHLAKLNLVRGVNTVKFVIHSRLLGNQSVSARIYLWPEDTKIVISDVDGTVTKSDVRGNLLPRLGKDWTHPGICSLYKGIEDNGYKILYLTARSISQIDGTRQFLQGVRQGEGVGLPDGPVVGTPDKIFTAFTREVITRTPHVFKIECLENIMTAFPARPFFAGIGNRVGDVVSYTAVGIPPEKILIVDKKSAIHVCDTVSSYKTLTQLVNLTFPRV